MGASTHPANTSLSQKKWSLDNLAARIQRLEDIKAIEHLITRYAKASDKNNDPDLMLPLFTEDGALDVGSGYGRYQGHEVLRKFFSGTSSIISWSLHYNISPLIEVSEEGRTAQAFWYLWELANMPDSKTGGEEAVWIGGSYTSDLVKEEDGQWKFKEIRLKMEIMSPYSEGWVKKPWHDLGRPKSD
ncbi:MAG TPA: nuclear transport factor 2 family protein [Pyrinomonadaceae bacterium]|nr:nuclear transport factor 2 family protein [Pyrinomonadaceae bacterium]